MKIHILTDEQYSYSRRVVALALCHCLEIYTGFFSRARLSGATSLCRTLHSNLKRPVDRRPVVTFSEKTPTDLCLPL